MPLGGGAGASRPCHCCCRPSPRLRDQDLVNAVRIAYRDHVYLVAAGIVRSFQTTHDYKSIWAMLQLLFNVWLDTGNLLC